MEATEIQGPVRVNSEGDPCPPWCVISHGPEVSDIHKTAEAEISLDGPRRYGYLVTSGLRFNPDDVPRVAVQARHRDMADPGVITQSEQYIPAGDAAKLADLIEVLAHATPEQHRELAAAVRRAAAAIMPPADRASCGHPRNDDGECSCASWPERAPVV